MADKTQNYNLTKPTANEYFNIETQNENMDLIDTALKEIDGKAEQVAQSADKDIQTLEAEISDLRSYVGYTDSDIVGVEVDFKNKTFTRLAGAVHRIAGAFGDLKAFGGRKRCIVTDGGVVLAYWGPDPYTETGSLIQAVTVGGTTYPVGTKVQVMVEQPKFYYKVVPLSLEKIEVKEINTLEVASGASADGNLKISLDGVSFNVPVLASDNTATLVATKIRAASYTGWTTGGSGTSVTFTCNTTGAKVATTFSAASTGVTATVTKTQPGYRGKGFHMRKARYYVSDVMKPGFKLHPAFISNGVKKNFIYLSAYEGSLYDVSASKYILNDSQVADFTVSTGDKLCSIAHAKPISGLTQNLTRANTRVLAQNRGTGWQQAYAATVAASQMLLMIEYASFNAQSMIGNGVVNFSDDNSTNMAYETGATGGVYGNETGVVRLGGTDNYVITYRGEENIWGNIWKWVDGLNIYSYGEQSLYVADNSFADNISTLPYKDAGFTLAKSNGYISAFGYSEEFDWLFFPSETFGDSSLPVGDYHLQNNQANSWCVALFGGGWYNGSDAGAFRWDMAAVSSNRSWTIGGRLVYIPATVG